MKISNKPKILRVNDVLDSTTSVSVTRTAAPKNIKELLDIINTIKGTGWTTENLAALQSAVTAMKGSGWAGESLSELKATVDYILASQEQDLGIEFSAMPAIVTGTRKLSNVGKTFRVNAGSINTDPYPLTDIRFQFPYKEIRTAKINAAFEVQKWIDEPGFDEAEGEVMVWLPKTYYRQTDVYEFEFSKYQRPGYAVDPLFFDYATSEEREGVWVSAFKASLASGGTKLQSQSDAAPLHSTRLDTALGFRALSNAIGTGWGLADFALRDYLRKIYLMAAASWDSQSVVGKGCEAMRYSADDKVTAVTEGTNTIVVSNATAALYNVGEYVSLGTSLGASTRFHSRKITEKSEAGVPSEGNTTITVDGGVFTTALNDVLWHCAQVVSEANLIAMGNESGYIGTNGRTPVSFFGMWDLWGNMWEWVDGAFKNDADFYYTFDPTKYSAIINTIPANLGNYIKHPTPLPNSNGYLGEMEGDPAVPKTLTGGSNATGTCDYFYQNTGYRGLLVGGAWAHGASVPGLFGWDVGSTPGATGVSVGARLRGRP